MASGKIKVMKVGEQEKIRIRVDGGKFCEQVRKIHKYLGAELTQVLGVSKRNRDKNRGTMAEEAAFNTKSRDSNKENGLKFEDKICDSGLV